MINLTVLLAVIAFFIRSISEQAYNEIGLNQKLLIPKCMKQLIEVFQRRFNGAVDFYLNWDSYVNGFGNKNHEFWLGLQALHEISSSASYRLRVDLEDFEGNRAYAEYPFFVILGDNTNYTLRVTGYNGTAGNSLATGLPFTTKDRDNDGLSARNCAVEFNGAWWYYVCSGSNLNGRYLVGGPSNQYGLVFWYDWKNSRESLRRTSMKIRPD